MQLKGSVIDIVFCNEENGYTVLNFDANGVFITAVGIFPLVSEGEALILTGEYRSNTKFGEQFAVENVEYTKPDDPDAVIRYLSSGLFRGIGEKTAIGMVEFFGAKVLDIIENQPELLTRAPGIGKKKASEIVECYRDTLAMKESLLFLQNQNISMNMALKIYKVFGENTIPFIKNNPYMLVEKVDGIGFLTADKIASKMGIKKDSEFRIQAGFYHTLTEASGYNGHTCLPKEQLTESVSKLVEIDDIKLLTDVLESMANVKILDVEGKTMVVSNINYFVEKNISAKLLTIEQCKDNWSSDIDKNLEIYESTNCIALHERQREAIRSIFNNGVSVITGGPGTGKTTIIKGITTIMANLGKKVLLCAPTGRASKRMSEATGLEAQTIHRLLKVDFGGMERLESGQSEPLETDILIVDEISMADIFIFNALVNSIPFGARLVLVGDKDQLPSVSCGNILSDIINSQFFKVVYLKEIYRQAKDSMIVVNAHRINNGEMPITKGASDFFIDSKTDTDEILRSVITMVDSRIPGFLNVESKDIQVLAPMKKGLVGVENLNLALQNALNSTGKPFTHGNTVFRQGDKVMQSVNNYQLQWTKYDGYLEEKGEGIFNGDIGYIESVDKNSILVQFEDGKRAVYEGGAIGELMLAYCVSVHKSQGCEFDVVLIVVTNGNYMIMTKNLLYTAVTRAKKMVVIVGDEGNINRMIHNNYTTQRYSLLKYFLTMNKSKIDLLWGKNEG